MIAGLASIYIHLAPELPNISSIREIELQAPLQIYSLDNKLLGEFGEQRRVPLNIEATPNALIDAILAAEDDQFYQHSGVDIPGLVRAASELLSSGEIQSGGSTITMQVARNFYLTKKQNIRRKLREIILALKIENELTKDEILELYLNKPFLGKRAHGFRAAAFTYYGKDISELNLAQLAMMAGLPKAPSDYNPIANPKRAMERRNWILKRMLELNKIKQTNFTTAREAPVTARYHGQNLDFNAPYVAEMAREKVITLFGKKAYTEGYKVYTTVNSHLQKTAQRALAEGLMAYDNRHGYRGAEHSYSLDSLGLLSSEIDQAKRKRSVKNKNLKAWIEKLKRLFTYHNLSAVAVIEIQEKSFIAVTEEGEFINVDWENGIKQARPFIDINRKGKTPQKASDVIKLGDVVRVHNRQNTWYLTQIPEIQGAIIGMHPYDGAIRSVAGGFHFTHSKFNRATQAKRQPGSTFKPFVYTYALENDYSPATMINDAPIVVEGGHLEKAWRPGNSSDKFYGPTPLRKGLYLSRNLISIRLLDNLGIEETLHSLKRFGVDTGSIYPNLSLALGTNSMTPLEIATGYASFANSGYKVNPYIVHHIRDRNDNIIYTADVAATSPEKTLNMQFTLKSTENIRNDERTVTVKPNTTLAERIIDERVTYLMNSMLRDVIQRGTATRAKKLNREDIAGKTGTTNGPKDAWFAGFHPEMVAVSWVGFDNNSEIGRKEFGGVSALPIWMDYMKVALTNIPETTLEPPEGVVSVLINPETGMRSPTEVKGAVYDLFLQENTPRQLDLVEQQKAPTAEQIF